MWSLKTGVKMVIQLLGLKMVIIELRLSRRITIHKSIMSANMFEALLLVKYQGETQQVICLSQNVESQGLLMYKFDIQPRKLYVSTATAAPRPTEPTSTPNPLLHFNKLLRLELQHEAINVLQLLHGARVLYAR